MGSHGPAPVELEHTPRYQDLADAIDREGRRCGVAQRVDPGEALRRRALLYARMKHLGISGRRVDLEDREFERVRGVIEARLRDDGEVGFL
jgi:hypothetical protein